MEVRLPNATGRRIVTLSLRANFSWTLVGNVVYIGCQWAVITFLAKMGSPEMVGQFALALAISAPIILFADLQLRALQATDAKGEFRFGDYLGLKLSTIPLALAGVVVIVLMADYRRETALIICVVTLSKAIDAIADVFYGMFQQRQQMDYVARSMILKGLLSLMTIASIVSLTGSLLWGVVGMALLSLVVMVAYDARNGTLTLVADSSLRAVAPSYLQFLNALRPRTSARRMAKLAWLALPLGMTMMLITLNHNIPRYYLERLFGEMELAVFAAAAYLIVPGRTVMGALGQSSCARLAKHSADGDATAFVSLLAKLAGLAILLGIIGITLAKAVGSDILTLLYKPEYAQHDNLLVTLMLAAALGYLESILGYGMTAARYFRVQPIIFGFSVVVTLTLTFVLVPELGSLGAAWAVLGANGVRALALLLGNAYVIHAMKPALVVSGTKA